MNVFVTNESLKPIAEKLVARLNELGVTSKAGKPLVVDQGYEAVAAVLGYRNQHALRHALKTAPQSPAALSRDPIRRGLLQRHGYRFECDAGLDAWVITFNGQEQDQTFASLVDALEHAWSQAVREAMEAHRINVQAWDAMNEVSQENVVSSYLLTKGWSEDLIPQLQAAGYTLRYSETYKRPFWECEYQASEDFDTEEHAWMDAWRHAKANLVPLTTATVSPQGEPSMADAIQEAIRAWADGDVWGEHPYYDRNDWRHDVRNEDTNLGYWEWVIHQIESHGGDEEHCSCGTPLDDGEGADGLCGDCADKASCSECGEVLPEGHEGRVCPACQANSPEVDRRTHTSYSFSIGAMDHDQLMDECAEQGIAYLDCIGQPSAELRAVLLERFDDAVRQVADEAVANFDFGDGYLFASRAGWEWEEEREYTVLRAAVFLESVLDPDAPSTRKVLTLQIQSGKLLSAELS